MLQRNIPVQRITRLAHNEIFVFGSNEEGVHGRGAALQAKECFGAVQGVGRGITGRCYAIPTRRFVNGKLVTLPVQVIGANIREFLTYAGWHPDLRFLVTPIGIGCAGLRPAQVARWFLGLQGVLPPNVVLPPEFVEICQKK